MTMTTAEAVTAAAIPPAPPPPPEPTPIPPWLDAMLRAPYFTPCRSHGMSLSSASPSRTERNMFCFECPSAAAFCAYCKAAHHAGHKTIQIRRSSYHDVVRVSEMQAALDVAGVQTYVINSAQVVFLNPRPQHKVSGGGGSAHSPVPSSSSGAAAGGGGPYACEVCRRHLLDPFRFCSLGCKLDMIRRGGKGNLVQLEGGSEGPAWDGPTTDGRKNGEDDRNTGIASGHGSRRGRKRGRPVAPPWPARNKKAVGGMSGTDQPGPSSVAGGIAAGNSSRMQGKRRRPRKGIPHRSAMPSP